MWFDFAAFHLYKNNKNCVIDNSNVKSLSYNSSAWFITFVQFDKALIFVKDNEYKNCKTIFVCTKNIIHINNDVTDHLSIFMAFPKKYENATWKFMNRHFVSVTEVVNNNLATNNLKILGIVLTFVYAFFPRRRRLSFWDWWYLTPRNWL